VSGLRRIPLVAARASTSSQAEPWHIVDATGRIGYKAASGPKVHGIKFMIDSGPIVLNHDQK
jgi:nitroreductase